MVSLLIQVAVEAEHLPHLVLTETTVLCCCWDVPLRSVQHVERLGLPVLHSRMPESWDTMYSTVVAMSFIAVLRSALPPLSIFRIGR